MTSEELYKTIVSKFMDIPGVKDILSEEVTIHAKSLTAEEAIGHPDRWDYPIITGKDVMIDAEYHGYHGQAFTDAPADFHGTLKDILEMPFATDNHARGLLIASINAIMGSMGLCSKTVHCKDGGPAICGKEMARYLFAEYGDIKVLQVGFQPAICINLSETFTNFRVLDLNKDNIGQQKGKAIVEDGVKDMKDAIAWADLILCTGSTLCNGTIVDYLDTGKETLYFGTSLAGTAILLGLKRLCFAD